MEKREKEQLEKLLVKASVKPGLDDIDHRQLTRLINQADAEEELLITAERRGKVIFTRRRGMLKLPAPLIKKGVTNE